MGLTAASTGRRALVVGDLLDTPLHAQLLSSHGFSVTLAESGHEAIELVALTTTAHYEFQLILIDLEMSPVEGVTTARQAREIGYAGSIVAMSREIDANLEHACRDAGCAGCVRKPLLIERLTQLIDHHAAPLRQAA